MFSDVRVQESHAGADCTFWGETGLNCNEIANTCILPGRGRPDNKCAALCSGLRASSYLSVI